MRTRRSYVAASTVLVALLSTWAAQAAPLAASPGNAAQANAETSSVVQQAAYRRCWITNGVRHCRWFSEPYDDYGYYDYYDYGPGYGYGPGIGFFFGGGGRGHGFHGGGGHSGHGHGGHGGHR
jgi:uncharacterized membrane protein YgcG